MWNKRATYMHYDVLYPSMNAKKSMNIIIERKKKSQSHHQMGMSCLLSVLF